jgi:hypothetical protein
VGPSPFDLLVDLAREQSAAVARGDLDLAARLMADRAALLATPPAARPRDEAAIREVLRRDRDLAAAFRERMLDIRNRALQTRHGRLALAGYHTNVANHGILDRQR